MFINGREVGPGHPPYIIAEMSCNHAGSLDNALALVRAAKDAGADAVKFQALQADRITLPVYADTDLDRFHHFMVTDGPWKGRHLHDLYKEAETPIEWWEPIMKEAERIGITCFPSVFDIDSIPYLEALGCPAYKVSSFELPDTELIKALAATGKPLIMSTGMTNYAEISAAIAASQGTEFALLHCVSDYPTVLERTELDRIPHMRRTSACPVGYSDHSEPWDQRAGALAVAMGACILERHLKLDMADYSPLDAEFSADPQSFSVYVETALASWKATAGVLIATQDAHRPLRRSLFVVKDIKAGEVFTIDNVRSIRPGHGLDPSRLRDVLGGIAKVDIERGTPLKMEMVG